MTTTFKELGLNPTILKSIEELGYEMPTPIQVKTIPLLLERNDIMGLAQTGTGKTAAFGLPLIQHLFAEHERAGQRGTRALILAPTRELANQIAANMRDFVKRMHLRVACVVGGSSISTQMKTMSRGTDILVATPGRLLDLVKRRAVFLDQTKYLILDEADQMLDLGFIHALREIASLVGKPRQTMCFSATMSKQMEEISRTYLTDPIRIQVATQGKAADKIAQSVHFLTSGEKSTLLKAKLSEHPDSLSLVFARTKHGAEKLMLHLVDKGFKAGSIHGNKSQGQRDRAIRDFKSGDIKILVATDVAARGIDIPGVTHVYNYELPDVAENYVHRIGRTARAGAEGEAIAFCSPTEMGLLRDVERLMRMSIRIASGQPHKDETAKPVRGGGGQKSGRGRAGQGAGRGGAGARGARPTGRNQRSEGGKDARRDSGRHSSPSDERRRNSRALKPRGDKHAEANREYENRTMAARDFQSEAPKRKSHRKGSEWDSLRPENEARSFEKRSAKPAGRSGNVPKEDRRKGRGDDHRSEKPRSEKPRSEKPRSEKPWGDKPRSDKPKGNKPAGSDRGDRSESRGGNKPLSRKPFKRNAA